MYIEQYRFIYTSILEIHSLNDIFTFTYIICKHDLIDQDAQSVRVRLTNSYSYTFTNAHGLRYIQFHILTVTQRRSHSVTNIHPHYRND